MIEIKVFIVGKDGKVGAMVKALAVEAAGHKAVSGARKEFLEDNGYYLFHFMYEHQAKEFRETVMKYIPDNLVQID